MHLKIVVANAAYKDRAGGSDLIQYELVPQLNTDDAAKRSFSNSKRPFTSSVIRDNRQIELFYEILEAKHGGKLLLPTLPPPSRPQDPGWGGREYLHANQRRMNRFFHKLFFKREVIQEDPLIGDFLAAGFEQSSHNVGYLDSLLGWIWPRTQSFDRIITKSFAFVIEEHLEIERVIWNPTIRAVELREVALRGILQSMEETLESVSSKTLKILDNNRAQLDFASSFSRVGIAFAQLTNTHCIRPALHHLQSGTPMALTLGFNSDTLIAERRFRELGSRVAGIIRDLERQRALVVRDTIQTLGETVLEQLEDLKQLARYINNLTNHLGHLDTAMRERVRLEAQRDRIITSEGRFIFYWYNQYRLGRLTAQLSTAIEMESQMRQLWQERLTAAQGEIHFFWQLAAQEMADSCAASALLDAQHYEQIAAILKRWQEARDADEGIEGGLEAAYLSVSGLKSKSCITTTTTIHGHDFALDYEEEEGETE